MPNDKNDSIRYLMKEMDPSEEVLMERSMMEDEDLLIEVECMRKTLTKLDNNLPKVEPSKDVTRAIIEKAAKHKKRERSTSFIPISLGNNGIGYIAAAAVVAVGLISGSLFYYDLSGGAESNTKHSSASINAGAGSSMNSSVESVNNQLPSAKATQTEPWVDRNEILRFQDQFGEQGNAAFESMMDSSTQKLTPLNEPMDLSTRARQLQLTGSEQ